MQAVLARIPGSLVWIVAIGVAIAFSAAGQPVLGVVLAVALPLVVNYLSGKRRFR
jgi:hypothetical protein